MEAGADKTESQLAAGKHTFLKKVDQNFNLFCDPVTENLCEKRYNINVINESEVLKWNTFTI